MGYKVDELVERAAQMKASDIHLILGLHPKCRVDGELIDLDEGVLTHEDCEDIACQIAGDDY